LIAIGHGSELDRGEGKGMFRFTIRELGLLTAFLAVGCAGLKYANAWWWSALALGTFVLLLAAIITALVGRGPWRAAAIGFSVAVLAYAILLRSVPIQANTNTSPELDPYNGTLPTSRLLLPVFKSMVRTKWIDGATGQEVRDYRPPTVTGFGGGGFGGFGGNPSVYLQGTPQPENFMKVGHLLWALVFGYCGGRFAVWVHQRSQDEPRANEPPA
jgi:hypothetical protein